MGLPEEDDVALIGVVTRLDEQKGVQLIVDAMEELLNYRNVQFVLLGQENLILKMLSATSRMHTRINARPFIDFDSELAQWIYAGVDFFLMPSEFEPCGLSQLNSLRYGTIPIVHEVGGLVDDGTL
ncbi:MAG: glycosyltransferase [Alkalibacterium sp.]|nr:glycosyltransferase [Alkalibacterium sp.]